LWSVAETSAPVPPVTVSFARTNAKPLLMSSSSGSFSTICVALFAAIAAPPAQADSAFELGPRCRPPGRAQRDAAAAERADVEDREDVDRVADRHPAGHRVARGRDRLRRDLRADSDLGGVDSRGHRELLGLRKGEGKG
jgi:hypothetical protein